MPESVSEIAEEDSVMPERANVISEKDSVITEDASGIAENGFESVFYAFPLFR